MKQQEQQRQRTTATTTASSASRKMSPPTSGAWIETDNKKPAAVRRYPNDYKTKLFAAQAVNKPNTASKVRPFFVW